MVEPVTELKPENPQSTEDWFVAQLDKDPPDVEWLLQAVGALAKAGQSDRAESWAELLQETLSRKRLRAASVRLLAMRAGWRGSDPRFREACDEVLRPLFETDRLGSAQLGACGLDKSVPVVESLRRLEALLRLAAGASCWEKTWGLGVVRKVDEFDLRVSVDFARKPDHRMSFAYAAEALQVVGDDHLMVRRRSDPDGVRALVQNDPGEVVRCALRSFGPLTVVQLQERLTPEIVAEADWKRFWDGARKSLKADASVEIPAKRSDVIRLLAKPRGFDGEWVRELRGEYSVEGVLAKVESYIEKGNADVGGEAAAAIAQRLAYAIRGAPASRPDLLARGLMLAGRVKAELPDVNPAALAAGLAVAERLTAVLTKLPSREVGPFFRFLSDNGVPLAERLTALLPELGLTALDAAIEHLDESGSGGAVTAMLRERVASRVFGPILVAWLCRHPDRAKEAGMRMADLLTYAVDVMNGSHSGETLRARNQVENLFSNRAWIESIGAELAPDQRREVLLRADKSRNWEVGSRRTFMANLIRAFPDLEQVLSGEAAAAAAARRVRVTSWRSYRQRQAQLKRLVEIEIPQNSKDIAHARGYGDLRENFEYKSAKDHQRLLLLRQQELETALKTVQGSLFEMAMTDRAGIGTTVAVRWEDGREERFCILGEWDRDEALGIIASESQLAKALEGLSPGDPYRVITDGRNASGGTVLKVEPMSDAVREWVRGEDPAAGASEPAAPAP
jgi:transcription elongation GreA/GreB family factor